MVDSVAWLVMSTMVHAVSAEDSWGDDALDDGASAVAAAASAVLFAAL